MRRASIAVFATGSLSARMRRKAWSGFHAGVASELAAPATSA